jgi:hypothetical protein
LAVPCAETSPEPLIYLDSYMIRIETFRIGLAAAGNIQSLECLHGQPEDNVMCRTDVRHRVCETELQRIPLHIGFDVRQKVVVGCDGQRFHSRLLDDDLAAAAQRDGGEARHRSGLSHDLSRSSDRVESAAS